MRLNKLEMHGFKSFAKKTEICFDTGITAVIGPNGSGKSNIADAVRWVLGEQSAKALRGAKMEDVIFNGTQERKAQAYCEVLLTFDNSDSTLPLDFNEVTVSRRVYRSGESEYAVNRNTCRLKDVQELFRDTGIGKEGYSIIGQGRVEEILSNRSNDRRTAIEEAAGVMKYRVRKEDAVRKLDHTRKNLERLMDILSELDSQREPLYDQAEKAKQYLLLRDELKELELNVFINQYERAEERLKNAAAAIEQLKKEGSEHEEGENSIAADCGAQEEQLRAVEQTATALQNQLLSEMSSLEAHIGELGILKERSENLTSEYARLENALAADREKQSSIDDALSKLSGSKGQEMIALIDGQITADEACLNSMQADIDAQEALIEAQKGSVIEHLNRLSDAKSQLSRMEAMTGALNDRLVSLQSELEAINDERSNLDEELKALEAERESERAKKDELIQLQSKASEEVEASKLLRDAADEKHRMLEKSLQAMNSRYNVLDEMAKAHEGYYESVKNVMRDSERNAELKRCVLGVVAELIEVPEQYETALEMSLGAALQNIVTPTPEHGKLVVEYLREKKYGRATLLPVSSMRPRLLNNQERTCLNIPGCIGVAAELVKFDEKYRSVVENLLGRTVIVDNIESGIALNKRSNAAFRIATVQGDIFHPGGSMTGGSVHKREFSLLGREREAKELQASIIAARQQVGEVLTEKQQVIQKLDAAKQTLSQLEIKIHAHDVENAHLREKHELLLRDISLSEQKLERNENERSQIQDNISDIEAERKQIEGLQSGIEEGSATTQEDVLQSQAVLSELRQSYERSNAALTDRKVQRMALQKEEDALINEQKRLTNDKQLAAQAIIENTKQCELNRNQYDNVNTQMQELKAVIDEEQRLVDVHKEQQQALEEDRQARARSLSEAREKREGYIKSIRELEEKRHKQDILYNRTELEFAAMQERIMEEYELTYENALYYRKEQFAMTAAHMRIDELKAGIRALGSINVNAVEDYRILFERFEDLNAQCGDLTKAESDLQMLIAELTATMEKKFTEQFQLIQKNFTAVFEHLFGGGWAELRLSDPTDALNCDIDIIAQPPGKKLQLLSLLSGGERALTAIALLFAILKLKPTVFCILDEIESSLDEVNVARFANYLREYAEDTQFILITHRKGSMEVCNALYGVAMEEKGVSKIVSAKFDNLVSAAS